VQRLKLIKSVKDLIPLHNTARFYKAFFKNYKLLLRHYQTTGGIRVTPTQNKELSTWLTNMKTALKLYYTLGTGTLSDDLRYIKYMSTVGVTYEEYYFLLQFAVPDLTLVLKCLMSCLIFS
jgi:hypothetical protein